MRHFGSFFQWCVSDLPRTVFGFDEAASARREALGEVELVEVASGDPHVSVETMNETMGKDETPEVVTRRTDLRQLVSSYEYGEVRYHLHAVLVTEPSDGSEASVTRTACRW